MLSKSWKCFNSWIIQNESDCWIEHSNVWIPRNHSVGGKVFDFINAHTLRPEFGTVLVKWASEKHQYIAKRNAICYNGRVQKQIKICAKNRLVLSEVVEISFCMCTKMRAKRQQQWKCSIFDKRTVHSIGIVAHYFFTGHQSKQCQHRLCRKQERKRKSNTKKVHPHKLSLSI